MKKWTLKKWLSCLLATLMIFINVPQTIHAQDDSIYAVDILGLFYSLKYPPFFLGPSNFTNPLFFNAVMWFLRAVGVPDLYNFER